MVTELQRSPVAGMKQKRIAYPLLKWVDGKISPSYTKMLSPPNPGNFFSSMCEERRTCLSHWSAQEFVTSTLPTLKTFWHFSIVFEYLFSSSSSDNPFSSQVDGISKFSVVWCVFVGWEMFPFPLFLNTNRNMAAQVDYISCITT